MQPKMMLGMATALFVSAAQAASPSVPVPDEMQIDQLNRSAELRSLRKQVRESAVERSVDGMSAIEAAPTDEEVGDSDSFGRKKIYLGVEQTLPLYVSGDCSGTIVGEEVCYEPNPAPGFTAVSDTNVGSIELPKKATKSLLCFTFTQFSTYAFNNSTAFPATASMEIWPTVQIENEALDGLTNANGDPFNGKLFITPNPIIVATHQSPLSPGESMVERERVTRSCTGGIVNKRNLRAEGLTDSQIKDFFKEPMTITFGYEGSFSLVDYAIFFHGIRIYGD